MDENNNDILISARKLIEEAEHRVKSFAFAMGVGISKAQFIGWVIIGAWLILLTIYK